MPGEVVALIGDNGAGKSTMVKALSGNLEVDSGELLFEGRPVKITNPQQASALGMEVVYQDLALAPHLNPVQNLFLGREIPRKGILGTLGFMDEKAMRARAVAGFHELGGTVRSFTAPVGAMSGGQRQQIAIVRAIAWADKVVFLDEPTAALGVVQTKNVLDTIKRVRDKGIAVVLISHSMPARSGGRRPGAGHAARNAGRHATGQGYHGGAARRRDDRRPRLSPEGGSVMSVITTTPARQGRRSSIRSCRRSDVAAQADQRSLQSVWILGVLVVIVIFFSRRATSSCPPTTSR